MKKITFYKVLNGEKKHCFSAEVVEGPKMLRRAVILWKTSARDIADFLHIRGNHLYLYNEKVVLE